ADLKKITQYWVKGLKFNIPLLPHYLASMLLASSDKIMIQRAVGEVSVGLYSLAYSYSSLALIVFTALNNAYTPYSLRLIKEEKYNELSTATKPIVLISVLFALFLMFLAPEGLFILGGRKYLQTLNIIPILIAGIFFSSFYFIFSNVEFLYEKTKWIFPITLIGAGLNILLNFLFIPKYGYKAAAYTTLISYMLVALFHYLVSLKIMKQNIYPMKSICLYVLLLISGAIASIFLYQLHFIVRYAFLLIILIGVTVSALYFLKKKNKKTVVDIESLEKQ
ncbi:MAG: polysaccharide biosynthesis protein, partial [Clostridia bacterium]|nr:polysaccharide biosynthesis protein [Clostridia bacterium]